TATHAIYTLSLHDALPISWSRGHWRKAQRQSTDREHGCAPGNPAVRRTAATTGCLTLEYLRTPDDRTPANHRANHPIEDINALRVDPTASKKSNLYSHH